MNASTFCSDISSKPVLFTDLNIPPIGDDMLLIIEPSFLTPLSKSSASATNSSLMLLTTLTMWLFICLRGGIPSLANFFLQLAHVQLLNDDISFVISSMMWFAPLSILCPSKYQLRAGILEKSMGARKQVGLGLLYRPTRLHRLRHRFLGIDSWAP